MNVEQRLLHAFEQADRVEPSADLWSRVVHSIEEDRAHRRRVLASVAVTVVVLLGLVAVGTASLTDGPFGRHVEPIVMEALETVGLIAAVLALGPAIRRFGRNYAADLFPADRQLASWLLRLLDIAYYLVFTGYVLLTAEIRLTDREPPVDLSTVVSLADQIADASIRLGGLLLLIGVLHAITLLALPLLALVNNSTRQGRALPRWLRNAGIILLAWAAVQLVGAVIALLLAGLS